MATNNRMKNRERGVRDGANYPEKGNPVLNHQQKRGCKRDSYCKN